MFSFHRPKVYRSPTGCCICKAKSSSSRFTDSKKYEEDFLECFKLATPRQGEICNACVLLVKRWKKLPAGSGRHWQHVVDARAGPGMKSFTKFKTKKKKIADKIKKKQFEREYSPALSDKSDVPEEIDMADIDSLSEEGPSMNSSRNASPGVSDNEEGSEQKAGSGRRKGTPRRREELEYNIDGFIDFDYWTEERICCGRIFRGQNSELMVDQSQFKPCSLRVAMCKAKALAQKTSSKSEAPSKGVYSDSSSDSGYDDSSNQGIAMSPDGHSNRLAETVSLTTIQEETVEVQVPDLMCHETIFTEVGEVHADIDLVAHYEQPETITN